MTVRKIAVWHGGLVARVATVDAADFRIVSKHKWFLTEKGYARTSAHIRMHRLILGLSKDDKVEVDHMNRNRLDNRRSNLRIVPVGVNPQNHGRVGPSGIRGVSWFPQRQKWRAKVRNVHVGLFESAEEAAIAAKAYRAEHMPYTLH